VLSIQWRGKFRSSEKIRNKNIAVNNFFCKYSELDAWTLRTISESLAAFPGA